MKKLLMSFVLLLVMSSAAYCQTFCGTLGSKDDGTSTITLNSGKKYDLSFKNETVASDLANIGDGQSLQVTGVAKGDTIVATSVGGVAACDRE